MNNKCNILITNIGIIWYRYAKPIYDDVSIYVTYTRKYKINYVLYISTSIRAGLKTYFMCHDQLYVIRYWWCELNKALKIKKKNYIKRFINDVFNKIFGIVLYFNYNYILYIIRVYDIFFKTQYAIHIIILYIIIDYNYLLLYVCILLLLCSIYYYITPMWILIHKRSYAVRKNGYYTT